MVVVAEMHRDRADDRRTLRCNVGAEQRLPAAHCIERSSVVIGIGILAAGDEPSGAAVGIVKISAEKGDAVLTFDEKAAAALGRVPPPSDLGGGMGDQGAQREPSADKQADEHSLARFEICHKDSSVFETTKARISHTC